MDPSKLTQDQRQQLWVAAGHSGTAPVGYGGEGGDQSALGLSGGSDPATAYITTIQQQYQKQLDAYNQKASDYAKNNPFSADDMMAKANTQATASVSPYYFQLLDNFMTGINQQRQLSLTQEQQAVNFSLSDLQHYTGQAKAALDTALFQTKQQYDDSGGYGSGAEGRAEGVQAANTAYNIGEAQRQSAYGIQQQQTQGQYFRQQYLPLQVKQTQEELGRQQYQGIADVAAQNYNNMVSNYNYTKNAALGAPPGVSPAAYQNDITTTLPYVQSSLPSSAQQVTG